MEKGRTAENDIVIVDRVDREALIRQPLKREFCKAPLSECGSHFDVSGDSIGDNTDSQLSGSSG